MKITDVLNEGETNDYQKMMSFVRNSNVQGLPPDQQIALALFRELERQKARNDQLDAELDSAEQRIDVATKSGETQKQALGKHQTELEKERAATKDLSKTYAERDLASKEQLRDLTDKLEAVKSSPGVDPAVADNLEKEIDALKKNGIGADKVTELEHAIAAIQQSGAVDTETMQDLVAKVNAAQATAQDLEQSRATLDQSTTQVQDQLEQIKQQLAHFREVEQTVAALQPMVTDVIAPKIQQLVSGDKEHDDAIGELEQTVEKLLTAITTKTDTANGIANKMVTPQQQQARPPVAPNPPQIAQQLVKSGDLKESKWLNTINWATGKIK